MHISGYVYFDWQVRKEREELAEVLRGGLVW